MTASDEVAAQALGKCEATGLPHEIVDRNSELVCMTCRKPLESCCEGDAGRDTMIPYAPPLPPLA